ncbi:hypothetical protein [Aquabacterium sp.]|uniref:hypothetical protein n=1 Tax=Aquabacterium sp. TaxID=1872578 RepID=UPI002BA7BE03|nr:hypothetical protein [Aquabacterium sp.]HSW04633.1 hypothetical protein [Aquabacterium sp.]
MNNRMMLTLRCCAAAATALTLLSPVQAAKSPLPGSPEAVYREDRANCLAGRTHQDRATCLREAGAALVEARRGGLDSGDARTLERNALLRCQRQSVEDRPDCERLARGEGQTSGSVEGGGVIKEIVTRTVGPVPQAAPAPVTR